MSKDRNVACKYYQYENGPCLLNENKTCSFYDEMVHCHEYVEKPNGKHSKDDTRRTRKDRAYKKMYGDW